MNEELEEDLLSAYLDDELGPEQRAECERLLATSSQAQQELNELKQLSKLIDELPDESVPREFRARVMQTAERRMLLPDADATASKSTDRPSRRYWQSAIALATTAALVLVTVKLFETPEDSRFGSDSDVAITGRPAETESTSLVRSNPVDTDAIRTADRSESELNESLAASPSVADADETMAALPEAKAKKPKVELEAMPVDAQSKFADASASRDSSVTTDLSIGSQITFDTAALKDADIGQIVEAMESTGDQIAVVMLTVVDRKSGLEKLQFLLMKQQIELDLERQDSEGELGKSAETIDSEETLLSVYVEATREQIASTLADVRREEQFRRLQVDEPIALATIAPEKLERRNQIQKDSETPAKESSVAAKRPSESHAALAENSPDSPRATASNKSVTRTPKRSSDRASKSDSGVVLRSKSDDRLATRYSKKGNPNIAIQRPMSLPADMLSARVRKSGRGRESSRLSQERRRKQLLLKAQTPSDGPKAKLNRESETLPLQVLFVLVTGDSLTSPAVRAKARVLPPAKALNKQLN